MKHAHLFSLLLLFFSCDLQKEPQIEKITTSNSTVDDYKVPTFAQKDRIEQVRKLAPQFQTLFEEHAINEHIPGIAYAVVVDGEVAFSSALGKINLSNDAPAKTNSIFRIASMTKSFTAMAVLKLRDDGALSLEDPASKFIPEMNELQYLTDDAPKIDIENLLTMTAGFPEDNPWGDRQLDESDQMLLDLVKDGISFSTVTSTSFEYSNTGYALLGKIISKVSGMPYQEYILKNILLPLGMKDTYWEFDNVPKDRLVKGYRWEEEQWKPEPFLHDGSFGSMGGLITSIEDFARYVNFHLSAWPPRNGKDDGPVKRSSLREMHTPQFSRVITNMYPDREEPCAGTRGYGFGLGITKDCDGRVRISHGGALPGFGSNYAFFPEYGIGLMAFCNLTYTTPWPNKALENLLLDSAGLEPRILPASEILIERKDQIIDLIQNWNPELENRILAENFYLDKSREHRIAEASELLAKAGTFKEVGEMSARNQLRGSFKIDAENGKLNIFFTLSPESDPKVQALYMGFEEHQ